MSALRRIGIYGGAFDPPHLAHLALAQAAVQQYALDQLIVLPTGQAWHKTRTLTQPEHRIAMVRLTFADLQQVRVDVRETQRSGPTYTFDTLQELKAENSGADLFLLMGSDQLAAFPQWHRHQEILQIATLLVALRADSVPPNGLKVPENQAKIACSTIHMPASPISATHIRHLANQLDLQTEALGHLVKPSVARYIAKHHLY